VAAGRGEIRTAGAGRSGTGVRYRRRHLRRSDRRSRAARRG
jgi:hypothetical protein